MACLVSSPTLFSLLPKKENRLLPIYAKYNRNRFPQYQIETSIVQDGPARYVVKRALSELSHGHIEAIHQGYRWMNDAILDGRIHQPGIIERSEHRIVFEFIEGKSLERLFFEAFLDRDKPQYLRCVDCYHDLLFGSLKTVSAFHLTPDSEVFLKGVDLNFIESEGVFFPNAFLDLVMDNILITSDGKYYCIDYEWIIPASFPVAFVFYRSLANFYGFKYREFDVERLFPFAELMNRYGISSSHLEQYAKIEENYQRHIVGDHLYIRSRYLKNRISIDDLMPCLEGTYQRLIQTYNENVEQLNLVREDSDTRARQSKKDWEGLIEKVKAKDDLIVRLNSSYSMRIGKAILFPFKYIRDQISRT
jgi:hypothetical protein